MIKRLRIKFVCITMTLVTVMLLSLLIVLYVTTASSLERSSIDALQSAIQNRHLPGRPGEGTSQLTFRLEELPDGSVLVNGGEYFDLSDQSLVEDIYSRAKEQKENVGVLREYSLRYYRAQGVLGNVYSFADISAEQGTLRNLLTTCLLIAAGGFAGFLVISVLLARWAIRPVEQAWKQQRQFVADASHELKTPLTVILTNAEMLQAAEYDATAKEQFADSILQVSKQMKVLVESLLQLARSDRGTEKRELTEQNLSNLVEQVLLPFEPVYFEQGLVLDSQIEPEIFVLGDEQRLQQLISILLDNGQKYSAPGSTAVLTLTRQGKKALLRFYSPGTPLSAAQSVDIFKRFYRLDAARSQTGSYGLGLSIAQSVVENHGGKIWAEPAEGGNYFCVTLPEIVSSAAK